MTATQTGPWPAKAIDAASHGAIAFVQIYYETFDEPTRRSSELTRFFMPNAKILWNGNMVTSDSANLANWFSALPLSRHDVQTLDCHPLAALPSATGGAPDLILNVTGSVLMGPHVVAQNADSADLAPQNHPRKFHEMFMLRAAEQGEGMQPKYAIHSSNFRFIG